MIKSLDQIVANINRDRLAKAHESCKFKTFEHVYPHALRHTFATRCVEAGIQPKVLQKIMGHSTISVTMDLYVHVTDDFQTEELNKLNYLCRETV